MPMTSSMPSQSAVIPSASLTTDCASSPDAFIASMILFQMKAAEDLWRKTTASANSGE